MLSICVRQHGGRFSVLSAFFEAGFLFRDHACDSGPLRGDTNPASHLVLPSFSPSSVWFNSSTWPSQGGLGSLVSDPYVGDLQCGSKVASRILNWDGAR